MEKNLFKEDSHPNFLTNFCYVKNNLETLNKNGKVTIWMHLMFTRPFISHSQNLTLSKPNTLS